DDKKYALTSEVYAMFKDYYSSEQLENGGATSDSNIYGSIGQGDGIIVDILNGNGQVGYAKVTGDRLKNALKVIYNAANSEKDTSYSYVILKDISPDKVEDMIMLMNEKYIKTRETAPLPTLANVVFVLGEEKNVEMRIEIVGDKNEVAKAAKNLSRIGYKNIGTQTLTTEKDTIIEYGKDNYFIAYKIGRRISVNKLVENRSLGDRVKIKIASADIVETSTQAETPLPNMNTTPSSKNKTGIIIDILNANGKAGYAKTLGNKFSSNFQVKYNATNYSKPSSYSYVVLKDLSKEKIADMVMAMEEKYIKIMDTPPEPTLSNAIFILGDEKSIDLKIEVYGTSDKTSKTSSLLRKSGYKNVSAKSSKEKESVIEYGDKNYFIAYKLGKKLGVTKIVEEKSAGNNIRVKLK
ncbi:MAG: LytR C-terminal domain-containing protein, partial [Fusobacteriaceae bacterium]